MHPFFARLQRLIFSDKSCRRYNNSFILVFHIKLLKVTDPEYTKKEWIEILNVRLDGTPKEAALYYGLEILPRLMYCLQNSRHSCDLCSRYFEDLNRMTFQIPIWMKDNDPQMKLYQQLIEDVGKHLRDTHRVIPRGMILSRYIVANLGAGALIALAVAYFLSISDMAGMIMLGIVGGIIIGWVTGKIREAVLNKQNRIF